MTLVAINNRGHDNINKHEYGANRIWPLLYFRGFLNYLTTKTLCCHMRTNYNILPMLSSFQTALRRTRNAEYQS